MVTDVRTQKTMKNLQGRDLRLDIYAVGEQGERYNIEIQRDSEGADPKRARYHSSMLDADMLEPGSDFKDLHETYVIFITEKDVLGDNEPIYHVDRMIKEKNRPFDDGEHIVYVNASMGVSDTALGKLMSDFYCTDAKNMFYKELSERVKYYKETKEGVDSMGSVIDELINIVKAEEKEQVASNMIACSKYSLEEIASVTGLPIERVRELAGVKTA
ncbi:conserved hypothetical protein (putative transposase or invertase) [Ruminococcaceae bacterium YRB3002]|nr:conserved hypothetical protein (putative transposase or invertase) [Ruminococcaceae bacterium YRB3002]